MTLLSLKRALATAFLTATIGINAAETIVVDTSTIIRSIERNPLGINFNYIQDDDANRPSGVPRLCEVLKDLEVKWVRYPGGEKSDHHRFALPPYEKVNPVVKATRGKMYQRHAFGLDLLDFDEFMRAAREMGAEPIVVVPYDSAEFAQTELKEFIEHAKGWVRYANVVKNYNVRYWEIGNENWHPKSKNPVEKRTREILEIAGAMRAIDPSIKIGSSGVNGDNLDFVTYSNYALMDFDEYRVAVNPPFSRVREKTQHSCESDKVFAVEFNAVQFVEPKDWNHDVSHCIQLFDMMGQLLSADRIEMCALWGTRWMETEHSGFIWYLVDNKNVLTPIGYIYGMWSKNLKPNMINVSGPGQTRCFATHDPESGDISIMIINQSDESRTIQLEGLTTSEKAITQQTFSGKNPNHNWGSLTETDVTGNTAFILPGISANVINITR